MSGTAFVAFEPQVAGEYSGTMNVTVLSGLGWVDADADESLTEP